jgi:Flp pilus assembly protein TadD
MHHRSYSRLLIAAILAIGLIACAAQPPVQRNAAFTKQELLDGAVFGLSPEEQLPPVEMTAVNDDMRAFLKEHVPDHYGDRRKVELILRAILGDGLKLDYNNFKTYTAQETFYAGEGNCMSFTNLFIALAREAGVRVYYQEVDLPPSWSEQGGTFLYNLHINALVKLQGEAGYQVVDFEMESFESKYERRRVPDRVAQSHYHNNMGVYFMNEGDKTTAFQHFREGLRLRPNTGYVWSNLGTLYRRAGHTQEAETAYLAAIDIDSERSALSNLSRLYSSTGEDELAAYYAARVKLYRRENPYYQFYLAEQAYAGENYTQAETLLLAAIKRRKDEHRFYQLLGLTYLQMGDADEAQKRIRQAYEITDSPKQREFYNHKLQLLAGH